MDRHGIKILFNNVISRPFPFAHNAILANFAGQNVRLKLGGGIYGWVHTNFRFSISCSNGSFAEAYNIAPNAPEHEIGIDVRGFISDDVDVFGPFRQVTIGLKEV